ncbi:MAG: hypothetical protein MUO92_02185 [Dehalococcoidales bacterium]|nr:hypothetical protein [Dehalococcoidales bacterium]
MTVGVIRTGTSVALAGVTKTLISPSSGLFMPSDAKKIISVKPIMASIKSTTLESQTAKLDVESSDVRNLTPFEVLFAPIGAVLGATANTFTGMEEYNINASLTGGEALNVFATGLVTNTYEPETMAYFIVSNDLRDHASMPQLHAKLGTLTVAGIAVDTDVAGTKYSFSGGRRITELFGLAHYKTLVDATDGLIGGIKYTSSEFIDSIPQELPLYPMTYGVGATGSALIPGVSRQKVNIPVKPGQVNIQDYLNCGLLPSTATSTNFIDGVIYE